jgi:CBS domain-containing protein
MKIKEIMYKDISSVDPEISIEILLKVLTKHHRSSIPVVNDDNEVIGMVQVEDIIRGSLPSYYNMIQNTSFIPDMNQLFKRLNSMKTQKVKDIMQTKFISATEEDTNTYVADLMIKNNLQSIPILRNKKLVGVVDRIDFLSSLLVDERK